VNNIENIVCNALKANPPKIHPVSLAESNKIGLAVKIPSDLA